MFPKSISSSMSVVKTNALLSRARVHLVRNFSHGVQEQSGNNTERKLVYESKFGKRIKTLRRISLGSSIISCGFLPASFIYESGVLPIAAQAAIAGTVFFTSVSSTIMLQLVAHPYVHQLYEEVNSGKTGRILSATRFNLLGNEKVTTFNIDDADKKVSHPFSSFKLTNGGNFYVYGENVTDLEVRTKLTKEG